MASRVRKNVITLPLKIILTQEGASFFIKRNKNLLRFKLADSSEEYGILLNEFKPASVQRLLLIDYISKIEVSKTDFISLRQDLMDFAKLVVYSLLYKQFDSRIFHQIASSDAIKKWNRANPAIILDEQTEISESYLRPIIQENEKAINGMRREILSPICDAINKNSSLSPDEKNIQLLFLEKLLASTRPLVWLVLAKLRDEPDFTAVINAIRSDLDEYIERVNIAEYIALMLLELAASAENANIKKETQKMFRGAISMDTVMRDPNVRKRIIAELEKKRKMVSVSWKIGGWATSIGTSGKLQIAVYNIEEHSEDVRRNINSKKNVGPKSSLVDIYDSGGSMDLGLYYFSYLSEACEKANVRFETSATRSEDTGMTVINFAFAF